MKNNSIKNNNWYKLSIDEVFSKLESSFEGLTTEEIRKRHHKYGKNILPKSKKISLLKIIINQLLNPFIIILIFAAIASISIGDKKDSVFILMAILLNVIVGTFQEWKAEKRTENLQKLIKINIKVKRDKNIVLYDSVELVPGDIIILESGNKVPADSRILESNNLMVDESLLTGESVSVEKKNNIFYEDIPLSERENMLYAGSVITSGRAKCIIVTTGSNTEIGHIAEKIKTVKKAPAPLIVRMERFTRQISIVILGACFLIAYIYYLKGVSLIEILFVSVALAVSAIPEGLPAALTVALSVGMSRMAKRNVIIRKLSAVEGLGSCTLIASDKTGTLTLNRQTAKLVYLPGGEKYKISGEGYIPIGKIDAFNENYSLSELSDIIKTVIISNEAELIYKDGIWIHHGDPVDVAMLVMSNKYGLVPEEIRKNLKIIKELPYESERKSSACFYKDTENLKVAVKGSIETILPLCTTMKKDESIVKINNSIIENQVKELAQKGYRVIAAAYGEIKEDNISYIDEDIHSLTFAGLIGLIDPLRPEVESAIEECKMAGIKTVMITGDHPETAFAIGKEMGIINSHEHLISGTELSQFDLDSKEFIGHVCSKIVFARVTPAQKLHIVDSFIKKGQFIAVTGDGVNDAPALKRANISVAMGSGTDIAKEVSSMVVTDDNFASIIAGVEEGRYSYDNIRKVIFLLLSTGVAEIILFIFAITFNLAVPLTAVQLLWLNLITNGLQGVGMAFEKGEKETMLRPPRKPDEGIFNKLMIEEIMVSGLHMGIVSFAVWFFLTHTRMETDSARNILLMLMVLFQNLHCFNCRSEYKSAFKIPAKNNIILVAAVVGTQLLHIFCTQSPLMQKILVLEPISTVNWIYLLLISISIIFTLEIFKYLKNKEAFFNIPI